MCAPRARAFSLLELVIVIVIISVVAAIAVPRMSHAATRAKLHRALAGYNTLEKAILMYSHDQRAWPEDELQGHEPQG